jgi:small subunit ribosomal protein S8
MTMTDPIADFLTRIRNAILAKHDSVEIPKSKMKLRLAQILKDEGFVEDFSVLDDRRQGLIRIELKWNSPKECAIQKLVRESRPGRRLYVKADQIPKVRNGHGIAIISTSQGVLSDNQARALGMGGEFICSIY